MPRVTAKNPSHLSVHQSSWPWILCLIGVDYFSTLGYQPSIAFEVAGPAAPLATVVVVLVTLLGALPVYLYVAGRSPHGQGAIGLLEHLVHGWLGKLLILILLGFAATDFVITKTLSAADATEHLIHNPLPAWQQLLDALGTTDDSIKHLFSHPFWPRIVNYWNRQLVVTVLLSVIGFLFWTVFRRGFTKHVIQLAVVIVFGYLGLNAVVIGSGLAHLFAHPDIVRVWWETLPQATGQFLSLPATLHGWWLIAAISLLSFPKVALGLSGFELSMVVMPLVKGGRDGNKMDDSRSRIRNTRKLLVAAAVIMSLYLLGSALVTTILIPPQAFITTGQAANRALAYLAHGGLLSVGGNAGERLNPLFGAVFGTIYDLNTIIILTLAGASVTIGLRNLVPQYLHRLGMEFEWAHKVGVILYLFNSINLLVTVIFRASVTAQRVAYATSVLVLIGSAAVAGAIDLWQRESLARARKRMWGFLLISVLFLASALAAIVAKPDGLLIALCFVIATLGTSIISRTLRSTELRFEGFQFKDAQSQFLWECLKYLEFPVLVPHRPGGHSLLDKEQMIRQRHRLAPDVPVVFVEATLGDASDFYHSPLVEVIQEDGRFILRVTRCASIAHVLAAVALELSKVGKPPELHFGWSDESPVAANMHFLLFGQGNVPWMVRELLRKAEPNAERRPQVIIG
jgi:hypothetical protein